jgi:hypothetical protein
MGELGATSIATPQATGARTPNSLSRSDTPHGPEDEKERIIAKAALSVAELSQCRLCRSPTYLSNQSWLSDSGTVGRV